jgi:hypothetical protein
MRYNVRVNRPTRKNGNIRPWSNSVCRAISPIDGKEAWSAEYPEVVQESAEQVKARAAFHGLIGSKVGKHDVLLAEIGEDGEIKWHVDAVRAFEARKRNKRINRTCECGSDVPDSARFCPDCGTRVS